MVWLWISVGSTSRIYVWEPQSILVNCFLFIFLCEIGLFVCALTHRYTITLFSCGVKRKQLNFYCTHILWMWCFLKLIHRSQRWSIISWTGEGSALIIWLLLLISIKSGWTFDLLTMASRECTLAWRGHWYYVGFKSSHPLKRWTSSGPTWAQCFVYWPIKYSPSK